MNDPTPALSSPGSGHVRPEYSTSTLILLMTLLVSLNLFNYIDRYVLPPVLPEIELEFARAGEERLPSRISGLLATGFLVVYTVAAPLFGWMSDRYSRWMLVGLGLLIQATGTLGSGLAQAFWVLLMFRCIMGVGDAAYGPAAPTIIADLFPLHKRGRMIALFYLAIPVGSAIGYTLGGTLAAWSGSWRTPLLAIVPPMVILGLICLLIKDKRRGKNSGYAPRVPTLAEYKALWSNKSYRAACLGMTAMTFAIGGLSYWMPSYLEIDRGISKAQASFTFGAVVASAGLLATIAGGWAGDALRTRFGGSYLLVSGVAMVVGFPLSLAVLITPFPYCWGVIFLAIFCLFFNTGPANTVIANVTLPHIRASAFAINIFVIHALGDVISPPIIGWLRDLYSFDVGFMLVSVMIFVGGLIWLSGAPHLAEDTDRVERLTGQPPVVNPPTSIA